jgi:glycosyltransferase involved in cell wall biosynthesis
MAYSESQPIEAAASKSNPLVSVIIPCYNSQDFVEDAIESVLEQTYSPIELVLVDDCSTDATFDILCRYQDTAKIHRLSVNGGVSRARNSGASVATGTLIAFLDSDDILTPHSIERRVAALQATGADLCFGAMQDFKKTPGGSIEIISAPAPVNDSAGKPYRIDEIAVMKGGFARVSTTLITRTLLERIGGWNPDFRIVQDVVLSFEAARAAATFVFVSDVCAYYRQLDTSLWRGNHAKFALEVRRMTQYIEGALRGDGALSAEREKALLANYETAALIQYDWDQAGLADTMKCIGNFGPMYRFHTNTKLQLAYRVFGLRAALGFRSAYAALLRRMA